MDRKLLGQRIRSLRKAAGLSQEKLGELTGVNYKYLGEIERGNKNPSFDVILKIAGALKVDVSDVVECQSESSAAREIKRKITSLINDLDTNQLRTTLRILKALFR